MEMPDRQSFCTCSGSKLEGPKVLSVDELEQFSELGYVSVRGAFDAETAKKCSAHIWQVMERERGILQSNPSTYWYWYWHWYSYLRYYSRARAA